jgi:hypothetical protein
VYGVPIGFLGYEAMWNHLLNGEKINIRGIGRVHVKKILRFVTVNSTGDYLN